MKSRGLLPSFSCENATFLPEEGSLSPVNKGFRQGKRRTATLQTKNTPAFKRAINDRPYRRWFDVIGERKRVVEGADPYRVWCGHSYCGLGGKLQTVCFAGAPRRSPTVYGGIVCLAV